MKLRDGRSALSSGRALPFLVRQDVPQAEAGQDDHALVEHSATRSSSAATAGAAVVMPAATVKPLGGERFQRSAIACSSRLRRSARSIRLWSARTAGQRSRIARSRSSDTSQCRAMSPASSAAASQAAWGRSARSAAHRASARGRRPAEALPPRLLRRPLRPARPAQASARADRSPAGRLRSNPPGRARRRSARRARGRRSGSAAAAAARRRWRGRTPR